MVGHEQEARVGRKVFQALVYWSRLHFGHNLGGKVVYVPAGAMNDVRPEAIDLVPGDRVLQRLRMLRRQAGPCVYRLVVTMT
jgi:hypothetical protein